MFKERFVIDPETGSPRAYGLYVPDTYLEGNPSVTAIHGMGGSARAMLKMAGLDVLADKTGWAIILPEDQLGWSNKDLPYIDACMWDATEHLGIGTSFVCGHSAGAGMATRLAYEYNCHYTALCAVSCGLAEDLVANFDPENYYYAIPTLKVNATRDPIVSFRDARTMAHLIAVANGFSWKGRKIETLNEQPLVVAEVWQTPEDHNEPNRVEFVALFYRDPEGEEHQWPHLGTGAGYDATLGMYHFFSRFLELDVQESEEPLTAESDEPIPPKPS